MPTTNIDQRVKRVADLTDDEVLEIKSIGVSTEEDLRFIKFVNIPETIPVVRRRKLEIVSRYLAAGHVLNAMITVDQVQQFVDAPAAPVGGAGRVTPEGGPPDPSRGAPKVYTDPL